MSSVWKVTTKQEMLDTFTELLLKGCDITNAKKGGEVLYFCDKVAVYKIIDKGAAGGADSNNFYKKVQA